MGTSSAAGCLLFHAVVVALTLIRHGVTASCMGCVELDEISFDKIVSHFKYTLVKFDIAFPYGGKHEIYGDFAKSYGPKIDDMLVSLVGIKDYGEKENRVLAERYRVDDKAYPEILLFLNGNTENYVKYPKDQDVTVDNLKKFVSMHTNIYIPLEGCLETFDKLTLEFTERTTDEQRELHRQALNELDKLDGETKERATIYTRLMEKVIEKGGSSQFIQDERKRVKKLLNEKLSETKKKQLLHRQNILQSFRVPDETIDQKDEL